MKISRKRALIAVVSLACAVLAFVPVATRTLGGTRAGRAVTSAQCAQLRNQLHRPDMSCDGLTAYRLPATNTSVTLLARSVATSSGTYLTGWLQACSNQACTGWWVVDDFGVTVIASAGAWNNWHSCSSSGTPVTWCGTWQNGGPIYMEEGFNFGNDGWARFRIDTSGRGSTTGSSYAVINGAV
jgi:hypothetical protein